MYATLPAIGNQMGISRYVSNKTSSKAAAAAETDVPKSLGAWQHTATEAQPLNPESADIRMGNLN